MGLNNDGAARVVFDIETVPLKEAPTYLDPAKAPENYKDPAKIAAYITEKNAANLERCGLDVDLCRIVAIGYQFEQETPHVLTADETTEADMLRLFWMLAGDRHLVGFNCLAFDLPVLLRRSLYLGVQAPTIAIDRFKHPRVTDLMQMLSFNGVLDYRGLAFYARRFGLVTKTADTLTGADIAGAVEAGNYHAVENHVRADIEKTAALAARLGVFQAEAAMVL